MTTRDNGPSLDPGEAVENQRGCPEVLGDLPCERPAGHDGGCCFTDDDTSDDGAWEFAPFGPF